MTWSECDWRSFDYKNRKILGEISSLSDEDKFRIIAKAEKERRQRDSLVERNNTQEG